MGDKETSDPGPDPWARATITVKSAKEVRKDKYMGEAPRNGKFLLLDLQVDVTRGKFTISDQHFVVEDPAGKKYDLDMNYFERPHPFKGLSGSAADESGVLAYDIPAGGLPKGSKFEAEVYKGQPFSWTLS